MGIIVVVPEILYIQTVSFTALSILESLTVRDLVFWFKTLFLVKNPESLGGVTCHICHFILENKQMERSFGVCKCGWSGGQRGHEDVAVVEKATTRREVKGWKRGGLKIWTLCTSVWLVLQFIVLNCWILSMKKSHRALNVSTKLILTVSLSLCTKAVLQSPRMWALELEGPSSILTRPFIYVWSCIFS